MKVTTAQATDAVLMIFALADAATADGDQVNELRLGDAVVRQIVELRDRIASNAPRKEDLG